jgi:hypothetical protein
MISIFFLEPLSFGAAGRRRVLVQNDAEGGLL